MGEWEAAAAGYAGQHGPAPQRGPPGRQDSGGRRGSGCARPSTLPQARPISSLHHSQSPGPRAQGGLGCTPYPAGTARAARTIQLPTDL